MEKKVYEYRVAFDDYAEDVSLALVDIMNILDEISDTETGEEFKQELLAVEDEIDKISSKIYRIRERQMLERKEADAYELRNIFYD